VRREGYAPVVDAIRVRGARRSAQGEVPLEEVFVERGGMVVFCWVFGEFVGFPDCRLSAKLEGEGAEGGRGVGGARIRLIVGDFVLNVWDIPPFYRRLCFLFVCA